MDAGWAVILAAVVSTVGAIIVSFIQKFRKENRADHQVVTGMMSLIYKSVQRNEHKLDKVDARLTDHIESQHPN
jgi:hypothetical protein